MRRPRTAQELREDCINRSIPEPTSGCWLWLGQVNYKGYPIISPRAHGKRRHLRVQRLLYETENGPIPGGLLVLHRCNVKICINIKHLYLGSPADNSTDWVLAMRRGYARAKPITQHTKRAERQRLSKRGQYWLAKIRA